MVTTSPTRHPAHPPATHPTRLAGPRTARRVAAGLATSTVLAAATGCGLTHDATPQPTCATPTLPDTPATTTAPDGGTLRIADSGYTRLSYASFVLVGLVIDNPTTETAYTTRVTVTVHAADGTDLRAPGSDQQRTQIVPVIAAGASIGFGAAIGQPPLTSTEPAYLTVDIGPSRWASPTGTAFAGPSVTDLRVDSSTDIQPHGGATFTTQSGSCTDLPSHGIATIYRDHHGTILGGSLDIPYPDSCPAAPRTQHVSLAQLPPDLDPARTTVHPYCGPTPAPTANDAPAAGTTWTLPAG